MKKKKIRKAILNKRLNVDERGELSRIWFNYTEEQKDFRECLSFYRGLLSRFVREDFLGERYIQVFKKSERIAVSFRPYLRFEHVSDIIGPVDHPGQADVRYSDILRISLEGDYPYHPLWSNGEKRPLVPFGKFTESHREQLRTVFLQLIDKHDVYMTRKDQYYNSDWSCFLQGECDTLNDVFRYYPDLFEKYISSDFAERNYPVLYEGDEEKGEKGDNRTQDLTELKYNAETMEESVQILKRFMES